MISRTKEQSQDTSRTKEQSQYISRTMEQTQSISRTMEQTQHMYIKDKGTVTIHIKDKGTVTVHIEDNGKVRVRPCSTRSPSGLTRPNPLWMLLLLGTLLFVLYILLSQLGTFPRTCQQQQNSHSFAMKGQDCASQQGYRHSMVIFISCFAVFFLTLYHVL